MKFDFCIGNPPYQETKEATSDMPVYNDFMEAAYGVADKVELITPARFLFNAGKTPKMWNKKMLDDEHLKVAYYEQNSSKVFPNTDIKGGVAITYRDINKNFGAIGFFSSYSELNSILKKVVSFSGFSTIQNNIYLQNKFNLEQLYSDYPEYNERIGSNGKEKRFTTSIFELKEVFHNERESDNEIIILGLMKNKRVEKYIDKKYVSSFGNLTKYKVIIPKSNGTGVFGEVLSTPIVSEPETGFTQSFISIGSYDSKYEAEATLKYIKTKFVRCMLGTLKVTQDNNPSTWANVPLQNFTDKSDINWQTTIADIDKQLYKKYGLSDEEINFIETHVKEME